MGGRTAPPPNGRAEMVLFTGCTLGFLVFLGAGGSMDPNRKSFWVGAVTASSLVDPGVMLVDLRLPRGKA